jgi:hypothetical protein
MELIGNKVTIKATKEAIKEFLVIPSNIWHLLPQDKVSDFKADENGCSFKVQGGITISLLNNGSTDNTLLLKSGEKTPFPFELKIHLEENDDSTEGYIVFNGEVNMFLKMMVEKPLSALFNYMSEKLKGQFDR